MFLEHQVNICFLRARVLITIFAAEDTSCMSEACKSSKLSTLPFVLHVKHSVALLGER